MAITEIMARIIAELEEFREENVCALINTVQPRSGSDAELVQFSDALAMLLNQGYAELVATYSSDGALGACSEPEARQVVERLRSELQYDPNEKNWKWRTYHLPLRRDQVQIPLVSVTDSGLDEARRFLNDRGYRWWVLK